MSTPNYSIYGIPAMYAIAYFPHCYALSICMNANNNNWDNTSPRSTTWDARLKASVPASIYACYERSEAAHKNGLENMPLFVGAVVLGNVAGLDAAYMNASTAAYCAIRALYNVLYIRTESSLWSWARTAAFVAGFTICMTTVVKAAGRLL